MVYTTIFVIVILVTVLFAIYKTDFVETFAEVVEKTWKKVEGQPRFKQVSISGSKACGVGKDDTIWCSKIGQTGWQNKTGLLKHISISGNKACGVNADDDIFCATNIDNPEWIKVAGKLSQIDLSGQKMCGANSSQNIFCSDFGVADWKQLPGGLKQVSISGKAICGTNDINDLYCADSLVLPKWQYIPPPENEGKIRYVETSEGKMCGINTDGKIFCMDEKMNWVEKSKPIDGVNHISIDTDKFGSTKAYTVSPSGDVNYAYNINKFNKTNQPQYTNEESETLTPNKTKDVLTNIGDSYFRENEDKGCKFVTDNLKGEENDYDIMRNYILIQDPNVKNQCYVKDLKSVADGVCSKDNTELYDPDKHSNIIKDIYPNLTTDKYVSKSLPQNACVFKFNDGHVESEELKDYLLMLDNNIPKLKDLRLQLEEELDYSDVLKDEITQMEMEITELEQAVTKKNDIIAQQEGRLNSNEFDPTSRQNKVNELSMNIKALEDKHDERSRLFATLCSDYSYVGCVRVPIGRYNMEQLYWMGLGNDQLSSLKIPEGLVARLYLHQIAQDGTVLDPLNNKYIDIEGPRDIQDLRGERWSDGTNVPNVDKNVTSVMIQAKPVDPNVKVQWA
jgi:hypothetical protein